MTSTLIDRLRLISRELKRSDALIIEAAIDRIIKLEDRLADYEEDITDWQDSVKRQMEVKKSKLRND